MEKNFKAADLIGKVIIIGGTSAKYIVKSVDGDKLSCDFVNGDKTTSMAVPVKQVEKFIADGKWTVSGSEDATVVGGVVVAINEHHDITTDADVAEVQDIVPVVTPKEKSDGGSKTADAPQTSDIKPQTSAKVKPMETKPKTKAEKQSKPKAEEPTAKDGALTYSTYKTKKGKTGARITGFRETDAAYTGAADLHASASYERDKQGEKVYYLCFGPRYAEAAKQVCDALNGGKSFEDCKAIIDKATEERAVKREEARAKREERKAGAAEPAAKGYSSKDVADMLSKIMAGGDVPEDIKALMKKAA